jgi:hypothetical protein
MLLYVVWTIAWEFVGRWNERKSYLHLWRYIGWLLGIEDKYLNHVRCYEAAQKIYESIFYHHCLPTTTSKHLVHHTLMAVYLFRQESFSHQFNITLARRILIPILSKALDLHQPIVVDRLHTFAIYVFVTILKFLSWLCTKHFSFIPNLIINYNSKRLKHMIQSDLNNQTNNYALKPMHKPAIIKATLLKDWPCGYYDKNQKVTRMVTNDFGILRGTMTISLFNLKHFVFCCLLSFAVGGWIMFKS